MPKNHIGDYNRAINIIEDKINNSEEITNEGIAKELGYEQHYFSKIFQKYSNMTIQEYVKKRKMSRAFVDLISRSSDNNFAQKSVSEVAEKYLYSADGFTKAFRDVMGINPMKLKTGNFKNENGEPLDIPFLNRREVFDYNEYIEEPKEYKIIDEEKMKFVGVPMFLKPSVRDSFDIISTICDNGKKFELRSYVNNRPDVSNWYIANYYTPFMDYSVESEIINVPKQKWLSVSAKGKNMTLTIISLSSYVKNEWIKKHIEYDLDDGYEIGFSSESRSSLGVDEEDIYEIWVPIKEKS